MLSLQMKKYSGVTLMAFASLFFAYVTSVSAGVTVPFVSLHLPITATAGQAIDIAATYANLTVSTGNACGLFVDGAQQPQPATPTGQALGSSGTVTAGYTFGTSGAHTVRMDCWNTGGGASVRSETVAITVQPATNAGSGTNSNSTPTVGAVGLASAQAGTAASVSMTYSGFVGGVSSCQLYVDNGNTGFAMDLANGGTSESGTATRSHTFASAGTYDLQVRCGLPGSVVSGPSSSVTVASSGANQNTGAAGADTTGPTVSAISPTTATVGTATVFSATYSDSGSGVDVCYLLINGSSGPILMTRTGTDASGTASAPYTPTTAGNTSFSVQCGDKSQNVTYTTAQTLAISAPQAGASDTDTTAPTVGTPSPATATAGVAVTFSATYSDAGTGVESCSLLVGSQPPIPMTLSTSASSGTATKPVTFSSAGTVSVTVTCTDIAGNTRTSSPVTVTVSAATTGTDIAVPVVGTATPSTATVNVPVTLSASYTDAVGVTACYVYVDGASAGSATRSSSFTSGSATASYTFTTTGAHTVRFECADAATNRGVGASATVNVGAAQVQTGSDATLPVVGAVSPAAAVRNVSTAFVATFNDNVGITACYLYIDGASAGSMVRTSGSITNGVASATYRFTTLGDHTARAECVDAAGNRGVGGLATVTVGATAPATDITAPVVSTLTRPALLVAGASARYSVFVTDSSAIASCALYANGVSVGSMTVANSTGYTYATAILDYAFTTAGSYVLRAECTDTAGNRGVSASEAAVVTTTGTTASSNTPTTPSGNAPAISLASPGSVGAGAATSYAVNFSSVAGVNACSFYVDGSYVGAMGLSGSTTSGAANYLYTFATPGTYRVHVECIDEARNRGIGQVRLVNVSASGSNDAAGTGTVTDRPVMGTLIKTACPDGAAADHPCKAVYYYGQDGMRHAFPHERVFFTWYADFSSVVEVTDAAMSAIRLGRTVTYRPGVRMVKFTTVPRVYAVTRQGELRWVPTEDLAVALYGANWARNIDDLQDAYFTDYTYGPDISSVSDFNANQQTGGTVTIDQNL